MRYLEYANSLSGYYGAGGQEGVGRSFEWVQSFCLG